MDENREIFEFENSALTVLMLARKHATIFKLKCITTLNLFVATFLVSNSPLYRRLIDSGIVNNKIEEIAANLTGEYLPVYKQLETFSVLTIGQSNLAFSEEAYNLLLNAKEIAKSYYNKTTISTNEIIAAYCDFKPDVFENFLKKCDIYPVSKGDLLKEDNTMKIPMNLSGCLHILNTKFSPDEEDCKILGRDTETRTLLRILTKDTKRNAVLVGEPGVGKTAIVEKFTWLIVTGNCPAKFKDSIVVSLDVNSIIAGTQFRGSAEERFKCLIDFLDDYPNCILFIDEIHNLLGAGACRDGDLDLANALKPILARGTTQVIGATTTQEYEDYFSKDGALKRRFEKIVVKEPKVNEVYPMIENQIKRLSNSHGVTISKEVVDMILFYASCFNKETKNPDRTLDLIDRAMATAELSGKKEVNRDDVLDNFNLNYKIFEKTPYNIKVGLAFHEAGHYLVHHYSEELYDYNTIALSIMPADDYYGAHVYDLDEDVIASRTLSYYTQLIGCKLAGRVSEKMFSGKLSAGASQDLSTATELAKAVVTKYGLSETFSQNRVYSYDKDGSLLTSATSARINQEIDKVLEAARKYAENILTTHYDKLELLVVALLERRMMSGEELKKLLEESEKVILKN